MDAPQPQQVEEDGEQDHQEAAGEQVVVVHKGEAAPVRVAGPERLLLDVSAPGTRTNRTANEAGSRCKVTAPRDMTGAWFRTRLCRLKPSPLSPRPGSLTSKMQDDVAQQRVVLSMNTETHESVFKSL